MEAIAPIAAEPQPNGELPQGRRGAEDRKSTRRAETFEVCVAVGRGSSGGQKQKSSFTFPHYGTLSCISKRKINQIALYCDSLGLRAFSSPPVSVKI